MPESEKYAQAFMKNELAFTLIGQQLQWSDSDFEKEFRELQLMVDHKYDSYQGFQPATRFHVALLNWLSQFPTLPQRQTAYNFVKDRLIFISQREMHHLVSMLMPIVERLERKRIAAELRIPLFQTELQPAATSRIELLRRRTLFVGLSDGARIDVFRRYNEGRISNEQVVAFSEISDNKWVDLQQELKKSIARRGFSDENPWFEVVCLVDDFSGSGSSLLRYKNGEWKGKIYKFYEANKSRIKDKLAPNCLLHIHHHLATEQAKCQIEEDLERFSKEFQEFEYMVTFSFVLPGDIVINDNDHCVDLVELLKSWYDAGIADDHTGPDIWYGYKNCGLPLVLEHNTPNNSVALLWATSKDGANLQMKPLFARRKRHSSNG
ncbi:hypothetical protein HMI48_00895 [Acidithiobacillus ferrooxidans]|uniref:phosphoribosyltransferase-like protein n=1 Tax=Acidithiobacillus ferrooxidans TaxID=920 RepID=UPI001C066216|nr:hypothetical protein [Acidithiobacillus ferrooxidans]MBU2772519.1 hypothetical protein [Acidithiobacillus ferrooxidans]